MAAFVADDGVDADDLAAVMSAAGHRLASEE